MDNDYRDVYKRYVDAVQAEDNEEAHWCEDWLHSHALRLIADGYSYPRLLARTVLDDTNHDFEHWYA